MHLHSLAFQAIGPFAGRHHVDLATLGASGIFLLDGPTGAGKSTIIDAIVFALYGKVASESSSDDRLRSAFAPGDVESFVDLVLEVPSGIFRVRRTPEYRRPKKRGDGTTMQQASVRLWRLAAVPGPADEDLPGELLSSRLDEAGAEIQRLVGLDRRQLVQTVVLPQGEFASFLRAEPEKRRDLLQKVFGTELYERAAARLGELSRDARARVERTRQAVTGAVEHFAGAAGLATEDARALREAAQDDARVRPAHDVRVGPADVEGVHAVTVAHARRLRAQADALAVREIEANVVLVEARERLDAERATAAALARRTLLRAEAARLADDEPRAVDARGRLDAATRATAVAPAARGVVTAETVLDGALERHALARTGVPAHLADADASTLEAVRSEVAATAARVARLLPVGAALPGRERDLVDGRKEVEQAVEERGRVLADLAARPAARGALLERVATLGDAAASVGRLQERALRARSVEAAARQATALRAERDGAREALAQAAGTARAAVDHERDVRTARIAGIAGELAAGLVPGVPCAVCGAAEHPAPAELSDDHTTGEDVEVAERARTAADRVLRDASARVDVLSERLATHDRASEGLTAKDAAARVSEADALVATARQAVTERTGIEREVEELDAGTQTLQERSTELAEVVAAATARLDELAAVIDADRAEIRAELDAAGPLVDEVEPPDALANAGGARNPVAVLAAVFDTHVRSLDALASADAAARAARVAVAERGVELAGLVAGSGFATAAEALAAVLDDDARRELESVLARHEAGRATTAAGLADPAVAGLAADARADVEAARVVVAESEGAATAAARRHELVSRRADAAREASDAVGVAIEAWSRAREDAAPVQRMAALTAGSGSDNAHALSLATFVLVRRFEDVVAAANERLVEMSSGRYELVRSATREDVRSRRTGLAMKVVDHVTERERDPRTLSGGETFYVSLCLALGLADVVTAEAGGVELGTLFVDEGFGSLDPETLDVVLAALGRLRAGGRIVGVVSHVEALKQSIAERIEVRRAPGGGSTLTVRA